MTCIQTEQGISTSFPYIFSGSTPSLRLALILLHSHPNLCTNLHLHLHSSLHLRSRSRRADLRNRDVVPHMGPFAVSMPKGEDELVKRTRSPEDENEQERLTGLAGTRQRLKLTTYSNTPKTHSCVAAYSYRPSVSWHSESRSSAKGKLISHHEIDEVSQVAILGGDIVPLQRRNGKKTTRRRKHPPCPPCAMRTSNLIQKSANEIRT